MAARAPDGRDRRAFVGATDVDPAAVAERLKAAAAAAYGAIRDGFDPDAGESGGGSLVEAVQTPAQREILDRITALMSLLEGHADYVMDGVGPVGRSRRSRRSGPSSRPGARRRPGSSRWSAGCSASTPRCGSTATASGSSAASSSGPAWTASTRSGPGPTNLPTKAELADPQAWVARVVTRASSPPDGVAT